LARSEGGRRRDRKALKAKRIFPLAPRVGMKRRYKTWTVEKRKNTMEVTENGRKKVPPANSKGTNKNHYKRRGGNGIEGGR